jgi:hypothetical protein
MCRLCSGAGINPASRAAVHFPMCQLPFCLCCAWASAALWHVAPDGERGDAGVPRPEECRELEGLMVGGWLCRRASPALFENQTSNSGRQEAICPLAELWTPSTFSSNSHSCHAREAQFTQQCRQCKAQCAHLTGSVSSTTGALGWLLCIGAAAADAVGQSASDTFDDARRDMLMVAGKRISISRSRAASAP